MVLPIVKRANGADKLRFFQSFHLSRHLPPILHPTILIQRVFFGNDKVFDFMADGHPSLVQVSPGSPVGGSHDSGGDQSPRTGVREQDRFLPIANISRIMKKALPANGKVAKDAKETVQECVSEFISFVTSEASDKCQREKRKTINGDDLLWAMATLGFEDYIDPLKMYLARYREMEGDTKGSAKGAEGSARKDVLQPTSTSQLVNQGSFSQGMNYGHSQSQAQHMMVPMHGMD